MRWVQALVFSALVPAVVALVVPMALTGFGAPIGGAWQLGWILFIFGVALYVRCLRNFVTVGGTPAIFFTRRLIRSDIYGLSRNPMYLAVILIVAGEAIVFASVSIAVYGLVLFVAFHLVVMLVEEPHLRARDGAGYQRYCQQVPRWIPLPALKKRSASLALQRRPGSAPPMSRKR
jgi:protein-S-isoprenylcysteine O-methyltransferase Ste14